MQRCGQFLRYINGIRDKQVLGKNAKGLSYNHREAFVTYVEMNEKSSSTVVCNGALKCGGYCKERQLDMKALEKCKCEKTAVVVKDRHGRRASASFYKVSLKGHQTHKVSCV